LSPKSGKVNYKKILDNATEKNSLGFLYQTDTLTLKARFSECGEFGGHKEKIILFCNYKREYFAKFTRDSIDLDCPANFENSAVIIKDTLFKINTQKEKIVLKYIDKLYKRALTNKPPYASFDYFEAYTRHKSLSVSSIEDPKSWNEFRKLQIELLK
jgi:hypothetical protein